MSLINACIESMVMVLCIKLILPNRKRFNYINFMLYVLSATMLMYLFNHDSVYFVLIFNAGLIFIIKILEDAEVFIACITVVVLNLLNTLASLMSTCFGIFLYKEIIDYRFLISTKEVTFLAPKIVFLILLVILSKAYLGLVQKKIRAYKTRPKTLIIVNITTYLAALVLALQVVEYLSQNYFMIQQIPKLDSIFFTALLFIYILIILIHYFATLYIFDHSHFKIMKICAETDPLTGVCNRKAGIQFLSDRMHDAQENKIPLTVCFIDVNNLKTVNDKWGHNEGDKLINTVCEIVKANLRGNDNLCRLGGDEFLVTFANCDKKKAEKIWERIGKSFIAFNYESGLRYDITVSYGFAEFDGTEEITVNELIEVADKRMYEYKTNFKKGFVHR